MLKSYIGCINIELGNIVFSLRVSNSDIFQAISQRLSLFATDKKSDYAIDINYMTPSEFSRSFPMAKGRIIKPLLFQDSPKNFMFMNSTAICVVDINSKKSIITTSVTDIDDILYLPLRNAISLWLLLNGRLLLHSAGVITSKGIVLFPGVSESGKSTIALNSQGRIVLSDENIIVRCHKENIIAYGSPWAGSAKKIDNRNGKMEALFFIQISQKFQCIRIANAMSLFLLLKDTLLPFCNERLLNKQSEVSCDIINALPCYTLRFSYAMPNFWNYIEESLLSHVNRRVDVCYNRL